MREHLSFINKSSAVVKITVWIFFAESKTLALLLGKVLQKAKHLPFLSGKVLLLKP